MTFEVYMQTKEDIERKMSQSLKNEREVIAKLELDRLTKIDELKRERRKYFEEWEVKLRQINGGTIRVINMTRENEKETRRKLESERLKLDYSWKEANNG